MGGRDTQESIMRLATRNGLIATSLAIGAIAAPNAHASGLISGWRPPEGPGGSGPTLTNAFQQSASTASTASTVPSNGFDYADAAIGAGVAGGVALLITGGTLGARRRSQLRP
jgi:hypothetical protein